MQRVPTRPGIGSPSTFIEELEMPWPNLPILRWRPVRGPLSRNQKNLSFRSGTGLAKLTAGIFLFKKPWNPHPLPRPSLFVPVVCAALLLPGRSSGQLLFDWPIRAVPQPEAVLTGAGAVFWNPGSLSEAVGTGREIWVTHIDGPDATGIRGVALAGTVDLPLNVRGGIGYWHLGISDIPRTLDSPSPEPGSVEVAEDALLLALAGDLEGQAGFGGGIRIHRASVAGEVETRAEGDVGLHIRPQMALSPRFGLAVRGLGQDPRILGAVEVGFPPLAGSRIPLQLGYGVEKRPGPGGLEQRISLRGSWIERFFAGVGLTRWGEADGWTTLWMVGLDYSRYSFSVMREGLANGFGSVHFYRASIRLPRPVLP